MARAWGSVAGSPTAVVSPTDVPGIVQQGFTVGSSFKANVNPSNAGIATSFNVGGVMGLLLVVAALWVVDRYL